MKKIAFLLIVFLLHVEADDTKVGTFDSGVSSVKIGNKQKAPIKSAKVEKVDVSDTEVEDLSVSSPMSESNITDKKTAQKEYININETDINETKTFLTEKKENRDKMGKERSDVKQMENKGVILPYDKVDDNSGVVLPMDEKKEKSGFFSIFGF